MSRGPETPAGHRRVRSRSSSSSRVSVFRRSCAARTAVECTSYIFSFTRVRIINSVTIIIIIITFFVSSYRPDVLPGFVLGFHYVPLAATGYTHAHIFCTLNDAPFLVFCVPKTQIYDIRHGVQ